MLREDLARSFSFSFFLLQIRGLKGSPDSGVRATLFTLFLISSLHLKRLLCFFNSPCLEPYYPSAFKPDVAGPQQEGKEKVLEG